MNPCLILLLLGTLPGLSRASPFQQRALPDLGKTVDVKSLMQLMMNDEEDGSAFVDFDTLLKHPSCPFGCQCHMTVVQCSDLGE